MTHPSLSASSLRTGLTAGVLNGLIGIGGGIVIVPAMVLRGASPQQAVGTSLATVCVLSSIAFLAHASVSGMPIGHVAFAVLVITGVLGSLAGGWVLSRLDARRLLMLFAVLVFALAVRLTLQGLGVGGLSPIWPGAAHLAGYAAVGLTAGALSGLFGVGGGALVVLALAVLFGVSVHGALPIALAINVTNSVFGALRHARAGRVKRADIVHLIPAAIVGIALGTMTALWLAPDTLRIVFGVFFCVMAVRIAVGARRR